MEPTSKTPAFNIHTPAYLAVPEQIRAEVSDKRIGQLDVKPSAINTRAIGNLVDSSSPGLGRGSVASLTIPDSASGTFAFTLTDNQKRVVMAVPDMSWYIGSISPATQWPNATYGMGNMRSAVWNDWGSTDNINVVTKLIVRNDTGSAQLVIAVCRWRIIRNAAAQFEQSQITAS